MKEVGVRMAVRAIGYDAELVVFECAVFKHGYSVEVWSGGRKDIY